MNLDQFVRNACLSPADWMPNVALPKTPFEHQVDDLKFMAHLDRSGLLNEAGVGKTLPMQAYGLYHAGNGLKGIYVMPPVLIPQFLQSFAANYAGIENYVRIEAFNGNPKQRDEQVSRWESTTYPDILVMSFVMFVKYYESFQSRYGFIVVDEATAVKSPSSKIHKAVKEFAEDKRVVLATGTPVETNVEDCYGLIKIITPDAYGSYRNFEYKHVIKFGMFVASKMKEVYQTQGYKNLELLHDNLYAQARRILKSDVSDLPPRLVSEYLVELTPAHRNLYKQMVSDRILEIGDELVDMTTAQALYQAMQQVLLNPEKYGKEIKENVLFETLDEIVAELEGRKVVVYAWFNHSVDTICERYKHLNPSKLNGSVTGQARENAKQKFIQDDTCKMVVANPKSGGVGIDGFQDVCSHIIYAEVCPFVGTFQQSVARLHRTGQKAESVNVYILVAKDTIAVKLRNDLVKKDEYQENVMKDKRAILNDLMGTEGIKGEL